MRLCIHTLFTDGDLSKGPSDKLAAKHGFEPRAREGRSKALM